MKLALIDGTNAVMRRAMVQTDLPKEQVVRGTVLNILDFVREVGATHVIVCFDSKRSWRRDLEPLYKADRTVDTGPWANALLLALAERGVACAGSPGYEADDVIAAYCARVGERAELVVLSSDNDLLSLHESATCYQYRKGGGFEQLSSAGITSKLPVPVKHMPLYHALVGGKNGAPGVPGFGTKKAGAAVAQYPQLELPTEQLELVEAWANLLCLQYDAPVPDMLPSACKVPPC